MDFDFRQTCFTEKCYFAILEIAFHHLELDENKIFVQLAFAATNATTLHLGLFDLS